jgi:hypothetical protein
MPDTEPEKKWREDNKPTPYEIEAAVTPAHQETTGE